MEDKQNLTEQQKILLSKLETLRAEMHRSVDARVDRSIQHILTSSVLEESPTLPLHTDPSVFKGKKTGSRPVSERSERQNDDMEIGSACHSTGLQCRPDDAHIPHGIARQGYGQAAHHSRGPPRRRCTRHWKLTRNSIWRATMTLLRFCMC